MKLKVKLLVLMLNILIFSLFTTPIAFSQTTLGNSTFPSKDGESFIWRCENSTGVKHNIGDLTKFTVESVYNDTFDAMRTMLVNYSIDKYDKLGGRWIRNQDNEFYMSYNYTLGFLNWSAITYKKANIYLVPTPINLTLIGEAVKIAGYLDYTIIDQMLILDYGNGTTVELTINSKGISTVIELINFTKTVYRWELNEDEIIIIVPFGHYYLFIGFGTLLVYVLIIKKRINYSSSFLRTSNE